MAKTLRRSAARGGGGCSENRRLAVTNEYGAPGLRERVIAVICEEWSKRRDNELESATIYERLINEGVAVSYAALNNVLLQLAQHNDITLETIRESFKPLRQRMEGYRLRPTLRHSRALHICLWIQKQCPRIHLVAYLSISTRCRV